MQSKCINVSYWKSLLRQIRIVGKINIVSNLEADVYYESRAYGSRIGAWASKQSTILRNRNDLYRSIDEFKKFPDQKKFQDPIIGQIICRQMKLNFLMVKIGFIKD